MSVRDTRRPLDSYGRRRLPPINGQAMTPEQTKAWLEFLYSQSEDTITLLQSQEQTLLVISAQMQALTEWQKKQVEKQDKLFWWALGGVMTIISGQAAIIASLALPGFN